MFKLFTIHANTCIEMTTPLCNCCRYDGVVQQHPLPQQTFFQLLRIMDPWTVDLVLKDTPDAVVHRVQIWRIGGNISGGINSWRLSAAWWQCHVHGEWHDFSDVSIMLSGKGCTCHATPPPLPPLRHIWDVMLVWRKGNINKNCLCVTVVHTIIIVHKNMSSFYRLVDCIRLWSCFV